MTEAEGIAAGLSRNQQRLLLAMRERGPKKWRAVYRHAKVRGWTQLPFRLAHPTLTGYEVLTALGLEARAAISALQDREGGKCAFPQPVS